MQDIITYLKSIDPVLAALYAGLFTWGLTGLGAALVSFLKIPVEQYSIPCSVLQEVLWWQLVFGVC